MKRAIITGATGSIGMALIDTLISQGVDVTVLLHKGSKRNERIAVRDKLHLVERGLEDLAILEVGEIGKQDVFFHLGWAGTFGDARNDMFLQNKNVEYTLEAVKLAYRLGCKIFIGAGSQAEYGRVDGQKLTPQMPVMPENGYGIAKLCAGQMSRIMAQNYGMKHIWFRILSVYGPYDGEQTMIMSSIIKMLKGESPEYTPAGQIWDYLYCKDAAKVLYLAAEKGQNGAIYCLGSGQTKTLKEYIEIMRDCIAPQIELKFGAKPYAEKQVMYLCADISNLQEDTGFAPMYSFEEGIRETVEWYRGKTDEKKVN